MTYSLDVQAQACSLQDALPVSYRRKRLRSVGVGGRLHVPLPSRSLISLVASSEPLHGHLPSPGVLLVLVVARLLRPRRIVTAHWHCFLRENARFNRPFVWVLPVDCFASYPPSVGSSYYRL